MKSQIKFINEKIKNAFEKLEREDTKLYKSLTRAFEDIEQNVFCGLQIPKRLI